MRGISGGFSGYFVPPGDLTAIGVLFRGLKACRAWKSNSQGPGFCLSVSPRRGEEIGDSMSTVYATQRSSPDRRGREDRLNVSCCRSARHFCTAGQSLCPSRGPPVTRSLSGSQREGGQELGAGEEKALCGQKSSTERWAIVCSCMALTDLGLSRRLWHAGKNAPAVVARPEKKKK